MLGIVSMAGNALKAFGKTHPAVKWGVVVLAFPLAAEFVAREGISLWVQAGTARATVEEAKGKADQAKAQGDAARFSLQREDNADKAKLTPEQRAVNAKTVEDNDAERTKAILEIRRRRANGENIPTAGFSK